MDLLRRLRGRPRSHATEFKKRCCSPHAVGILSFISHLLDRERRSIAMKKKKRITARALLDAEIS